MLKIEGGSDQTCALLTGGAVKCWGGNFYGEDGDGTATEQDSPVDTGITNATDISMGLGEHSCAILTGGAAKCWGEGDYGECGDGTFNFENDSPVDVTSFSSGVSIQLGNTHTCAIVSGGNVKCWGSDSYGELGDEGSSDSDVPVSAGVTGAVAIAAGGDGYYNHTCAIVAGGKVVCWGANTYGELGDGTNTDNPSPVTAITSGAVAIAAGFYHTCAYMGDSTVQCWGYNSDGELGDGTNTDSNVPVKVLGF